MKNKYIKILLIILIFVIVFSGKEFLTKDNNDINLEDDFYNYINKDLLAKNEIKENEIGWSTFTIAQEEVNEDVSLIIEDIINNKENPNLNNLYNNFINTDFRNKVGINPLKKYINMIDNSNNINVLVNNAIKIENELGLSIFTTMSVNSNMKNTSENIVYLYPVSFDFGSSCEYYSNEDYSYYEALIKQYGIKILKLYGYDTKKAREVSNKLNEFYNNVCSNSKTNIELSDYSNLHNIITKEELKEIYSNVDIDYYLKINGIDNQEYFNIVDKNNYESINLYLTNDNLDLLKEHIKLQILETYSSYLSFDYMNLSVELSNKLSGIEESDETINNYAEEVVKTYFSSKIDKKYVNKYFSNDKKIYIENMVNDILSYYKENLRSIDWLSSDTKDNAIKKLDNIKINVGYPEEYSSYSNLYNIKTYEENSNLVENIISVNKTISNYEIERLNNNKKEWQIPLTEVNAFYNPLDNSINFPASLGRLVDENASYYKNLGSIGMIIAHEITHAFDNNGALFDENGNYSNWWNEKDYDNFELKQQEVIDYYSKYEIMDGLYVNGELTVSENIADLGAVNCIVEIAKNKNASEEEYKELFESYANLWISEYTDNIKKILLLVDTHSPDKIRVNGVLSSIDKFYEIYDINKKDKMYIEKEQRVKVW